MIIVFVSLGTWQLNRADERAAQAEHITKTVLSKTLNINEDSDTMQAYQKAEVKGRYLYEDEFLLDNIIYKGKPGYYVITPFRLSDTQELILINRGWLAKTAALPQLPDTYRTEPERLHKLSGVLAEPRSKPVVTGNIDSPQSSYSNLWYYMDVAFFEEKAGYSVLPLVLRLNPDTTSGFVRDWPKYQVKTGMHIGYAIQWFVFAIFVLIAWIGIVYKNKDKKESSPNV